MKAFIIILRRVGVACLLLAAVAVAVKANQICRTVTANPHLFFDPLFEEIEDHYKREKQSTELMLASLKKDLPPEGRAYLTGKISQLDLELAYLQQLRATIETELERRARP